jgi:hypothetical protein
MNTSTPTHLLPKDFESYRQQKEESAQPEPAHESPTVSTKRKAEFLGIYVDDDTLNAFPYFQIQAVQVANITREEQTLFITVNGSMYGIHGKGIHMLCHRLLDCRLSYIKAGRDGVTHVEWGKAQRASDQTT